MKFSKEKISVLAASRDFRFAAVSVINTYIDKKFGLSIHEFPDSIEITNIKDELEDMLRMMIQEDSFESEEIMYFLNSTFDDDFLKRAIMY